MVIYSLRAAQSRNEELRFSHGILNYMQSSFGVGWVGMAFDILKLTRVLLVNPTYGSETYDQSPAGESSPSTPKPGDFPGEPPIDTLDQPRRRFWCRRFTDGMSALLLVALIPGIVVNSNFRSVVDNPEKSNYVNALRSVFLLLRNGYQGLSILLVYKDI